MADADDVNFAPATHQTLPPQISSSITSLINTDWRLWIGRYTYHWALTKKFEINEQELLLMRYDDILAVVE